MLRRRLSSCLVGATLGALAAFVIELRALDAASAAPTSPAAYACLFALAAPFVLLAAVLVASALVVVDPAGPTGLQEILANLRAGSLFERVRHAAALPMAVVGWGCALVASAHAATRLLAHGSTAESGGAAALATLAIFGLAALVAAALTSPLRKALAHLGSHAAGLLDPVATGFAAVAVGLALLIYGVRHGDTSGGGGVLGVFGVLRRRELQLEPVYCALFVFAGAASAPAMLRRASTRMLVAASLALCAVWVSSVAFAAARLRPEFALEIERHGALARPSLALLRKLSDRDRDGAAAYFAGGDCDDHDAKRAPSALDIPGNGVDEDCSGADTPKRVAPAPATAAPAVSSSGETSAPARAPLNVILITIDTLRADLSFAGYAQPVTPELDKFASASVVYERMYALASYTGKSIGPMMIGRYPSETLRDGNHFNTYLPGNLLVAERLRDRGVLTMGANSLWYLAPWSGVAQGFDQWDVSATPPGGGDKDNYVTADKVTAVAQKLLGGISWPGRNFFAWFHYFDPHAEYMKHREAPDFSSGPIAERRAYDGEVWYTDSQVGALLRYIDAQPWAASTAVVITADHGEAFGEHGMSFHGRELWECLVRVPFLVRIPGQAARRVGEKRSHIDLVPTLLDLALGAPQSSSGANTLRGTSLRADFAPDADDSVATPQERDVYIDMPLGPFNPARRALITGVSPGTKLINLGAGQMQIFDLAADPGELHDLARTHEQAHALKQKMEELRGGLDEHDVKPVGGAEP